MKSALLNASAAIALSTGAAPAFSRSPMEIVHVDTEDAEMNAAIKEARSTLPEFFALLAKPVADETEFRVEFDIADGEEVEHVWARNLDRSTVPMTGELVNKPELTGHKVGDRVPIPEEHIIDWSYRKGRVVQGAATKRVLLKFMPPEKAAELRAEMGW